MEGIDGHAAGGPFRGENRGDGVGDGVEVVGGFPRPHHRAVGLKLDEVAGDDGGWPAQRLGAPVGERHLHPGEVDRRAAADWR